MGIFNALREGDCEFDAIDNEKDTALHLAAEYGSENYATSLLYSGVYCSGECTVMLIVLHDQYLQFHHF